MRTSFIRIASLFLLPLLLWTGCKEDSDIVSAFEVSLSFPEGKVVNGAQAYFTVTSNRPWQLVSDELAQPKDFDMESVKASDVRFRDHSASYPAGTTEFYIDKSAVNIKETHKGKLTIVIKDTSTGAVKTASSTYTAYKTNEFSLLIDTPVVRKGQDFVFRIYSPSASSFTVSEMSFTLATDNKNPDNGIVIGRKYELKDNYYTFSVPCRLSGNIGPADASITLSDETGIEKTIEVKEAYVALDFDASLSEGYTSCLMSGTNNQHGNTAKLRINGGAQKFKVSTKSGSSSVLKYSPDDSFTSRESTLDVQVDGKGSAELFVRGDALTNPGYSTIIVHPLLADKYEDNSSDADIELQVFVKPATYILIGGDFTYTPESFSGSPSIRNGVCYLNAWETSKHTYIRQFHVNVPMEGWTGCPTAITSRIVPIVTENLPDVILGAGITPDENVLYNASLSGFYQSFIGKRGPGITSKGCENKYFEKSTVETHLGDILDGNITNYADFKQFPYGVSFTVKGTYPTNTDKGDRENFFGDGQYPPFNKPFIRKQSVYSTYSSALSQMMNPAILPGGNGKLNIVYSYSLTANNEVCSSVSVDNSSSTFDIPMYSTGSAGSYGTIVRRVDSPTSGYNSTKHVADGTVATVYPWHKSIVTPKVPSTEGNNLTSFLNKWCDCVVMSNLWMISNTNGKFGEPSYEADAVLSEGGIHTTQWEDFSLSVSAITYDKSKMDILGVIYTFPIVDPNGGFEGTNKYFYNGGDYWWHKVDQTPLWVPAYTGDQIQVIDKRQ